MNLILIDPGEPGAAALLEHPGAPAEVRLGRRVARHIAEVLGLAEGGRVRVGVLDGPRGHATIAALSPHEVTLTVELDPGDVEPPPALDLVLAVPRPQQLRRTLAHAVALGVSRVLLVNSWYVDKSYLRSTALRPDELRLTIREALEQAGATRAPEVGIFKRFRPFVEDDLPGLLAPEGRRLVATPAGERALADVHPIATDAHLTLAIGPERGFNGFEVACFEALGFDAVTLGARVLRVETAVPAALAQLQLLRGLSAARSGS